MTETGRETKTIDKLSDDVSYVKNYYKRAEGRGRGEFEHCKI